jgi:Tol biopolymer transport system component
LTNSPGYDAEATVSPDEKTIIFTSERDGDLELYSMDMKGKNVKRLTNEIGYDGGAFFSPDSKMIVYRGSHPTTPEETARYKDLLAHHLVVPTIFEVWVMNADGSNKRQVTKLDAASFAPYFTPDGKRIIFCTNYFDPERSNRRKQPNFDLAVINIDGTGLERITFNESFDGFPMFSPNGKKLVFASNRNAAKPGDTNVFIADWVK